MVDFFSIHAIEEDPSSLPPQSSSEKEPVFVAGDPARLVDVSFADSLLDFDSIEEELFEDNLQLDAASLDKVDIGEFEQIFEGMDCVVPCVNGSDSVSREGQLIGEGSDCSAAQVKEEPLEELQRGEVRGCSIEAEMGRVSLVGNGNGDGVVDVKCEAVAEEEILSSVAVKIEAAGDEVEAPNAGSLVSCSSSAVDIGNGVAGIIANGGEGDSDSDGESSSSDSSSSSSSESESSSSDDEEEEEKKDRTDLKSELKLDVVKQVTEVDIEEGEIRDSDGDNVLVGSEEDDDDETGTEVNIAEEMVEWSDADDEDDGGVGVEKGPIRSKNELQVLPPVPPVNAVLLPHHQPQPVGLVSSVLGTQVIVEGVEKHNPLNEGSILWLTEKRSPLGLIDEIFGPVKNPFYIVRFNSESEVPEGICEGALVSFVPEFADFVLSDQSLYKKGYDASGENDEELSDEMEFSDDEKEAEYRRMQKMSKRGMNNGQAVGNNNKRNKKRVEERQGGDWKSNNNYYNNNNKPSLQQARTNTSQNPHNANQRNSPPIPAPAPVPVPASNNGNAFAPTFRPMMQQQNPGHFHGNWPNGGFPEHQQNPAAAMFGGFPPPPGNIQNLQNALQMVMQNLMPFQQQFNPGQGPHPGNVMLPGGPPPNFYPGPGFMPWPAAAAAGPGPGAMNQGCFNQPPFGMGFPPQPANPTMNMGGQGMMAGNNGSVQSSANIPGSTNQSLPPQQPGNSHGGQPHQNFNMGGGMGFLPQPTNQTMNMEDHKAMMAVNGSVQPSTNILGSTGHSPRPRPPQQSGNTNSLGGQRPRNFNMGSGRGRKPFHRRGGGRFGGRGGR